MVIADGVKPGEVIALADPNAKKSDKKGDKKGGAAMPGHARPAAAGREIA